MNNVEKLRTNLNRVQIALYLSDREFDCMEKFRKLKEDYLRKNGYMKDEDEYDYTELVMYILGEVFEGRQVDLKKGEW